MSQELNHRYHPIKKRFIYGIVPEAAPEQQTCRELPEYEGEATFGFRLNEVPEKRAPVSSLRIQRVSDGQFFTEVVVQPGPTQFYSNYHNDVFSRDGLILFSEDNDGEQFNIWYEQCGSVNSFENQKYVQELTLLGKLSRDGSLPMLANLNANLNKIINLVPGTNPSDSVNFAQLTTVINNLATETTARTNADNSINSRLNPLTNLVKWVEATTTVRDYANDNSSGTLGMESYAPHRGTLFWRNTRANISGCGSYGNGDTPFEIIDTGSQFNFRWSHHDNALMEWMLLKW
ncbi:hypothetical protein FH593_20600 (plasmid) [Leptospira interrogans]|uniref:hypothetical protein n=2 Tax=Leptospira interrogans TaxID=173 RepID=UPI00030284B2|nr:hypothetical protein [Leptospira interrogans]ULG90728.1 hypothetical protein FH593_20600 [Leptospira interrogans]UML78428.1 hypothetical protein FH583_21345 [Leptospira interrogans]